MEFVEFAGNFHFRKTVMKKLATIREATDIIGERKAFVFRSPLSVFSKNLAFYYS